MNEHEGSPSPVWQRAKLIVLIALGVVLAALGGIGVALGLLSSSGAR